MWFEKLSHTQSGKTDHILFCFPYAGGSAEVFRGLSICLAKNIAVYALQLPGGGSRFGEALSRDMEKILQAVHGEMRHLINGSRFSLFGHSNGGLFAYELANRLNNENQSPANVFISAEAAPHITNFKEDPFYFSDAQLSELLVKYGGTHDEVISNEDFKAIFFPIIRNDLSLNYHMKHYLRQKHSVSELVLIHGQKDKTMSKEDMLAWENYTCGGVDIHLVDSDHFFIQHIPQVVADIIHTRIALSTKQERPMIV
ncbi:thioesterase II family protein [Photorhabdus viridis]|uniref:thioesterase II family protein n=1 Tax=Photorhabdus viridis TaxID=3163327 RepID=UPI00330786D3